MAIISLGSDRDFSRPQLAVYAHPPVLKFEGAFEFLSNFNMRPVTYRGITFPSREHAFQADKCEYDFEREKFVKIKTAAKAKTRGKEVKRRADWEVVKYQVMFDIVYAFFKQHKDMRKKLIATGDALLVEGNWWNDTTWGVCRGIGENWLGRILMHVRTIFQCRKALRKSVRLNSMERLNFKLVEVI